RHSYPISHRHRCFSRLWTMPSGSDGASTPDNRRTTPVLAQSCRSPTTEYHNQETFQMMATRRHVVMATAALLAVVLVAGVALVVRQMFFGPTTITAYFPTVTAIYPGDEVRVSGVKVGTIASIDPEGTQT